MPADVGPEYSDRCAVSEIGAESTGCSLILLCAWVCVVGARRMGGGWWGVSRKEVPGVAHSDRCGDELLVIVGESAAISDCERHGHVVKVRGSAIAGGLVARRWDALAPSGSLGHTSHDGDPLDAYQQWIKEHRLALTVAVEGLGSDEPRWDSAMVEGVAVQIGEPDPPRIFTSMNVLKAEFLVARRLACEGERLRKSHRMLNIRRTRECMPTLWTCRSMVSLQRG